MIRLTRRYRFSASHRLESAALDGEQNRALYGKCNNPYGHGHDYLLEVTVAGEPRQPEGLVVKLRDLDALVEEHVVRVLDHSNLNTDAPEFALDVPTTENLAAAIERRLKEDWTQRFGSSGPKLAAIRLAETPRNRVELRS